MIGDIFRDSDELTNALTERIKEILAANPPTNGDRLREMTDEDLAEFLVFSRCAYPEKQCTYDDVCQKCWLEWLKNTGGGRRI